MHPLQSTWLRPPIHCDIYAIQQISVSSTMHKTRIFISAIPIQTLRGILTTESRHPAMSSCLLAERFRGAPRSSLWSPSPLWKSSILVHLMPQRKRSGSNPYTPESYMARHYTSIQTTAHTACAWSTLASLQPKSLKKFSLTTKARFNWQKTQSFTNSPSTSVSGSTLSVMPVRERPSRQHTYETSDMLIGKKIIRTGSVYTLPEPVTLSPKIPSCVCGDSHKSALQRKIFVTTQTSTISVTNAGRVH